MPTYYIFSLFFQLEEAVKSIRFQVRINKNNFSVVFSDHSNFLVFSIIGSGKYFPTFETKKIVMFYPFGYFFSFQMASEHEVNAKNQRELEGSLKDAKHALLDVQHQLRMAEKELEKKFSQTGAYK